MADFYLKSGSATEAALSTAYALGAKVVIARADTSTNYAVVRKWVLECTTAGTSGAAVPAWPATVTQDTTTVTDGTVVWTFRKPGFSSGATANWTFSAIYMDYVLSAMAAGDTLYMSHLHAESTAAAITLASPGTVASPVRVICGNDAAAPPTALATTGSVATTGAFNITHTGVTWLYGVTINSGQHLTLTGSVLKLASSVLQLASTGTAFIYASSYSAGTVLEFVNTNISFANTTHGFKINGLHFVWQGGALLGGSGTLFALNNAWGQNTVTIRGVDMSAAAGQLVQSSNSVQSGSFVFENCKLHASYANTQRNTQPGMQSIKLHACDSAATNYRVEETSYEGTITQETTIVRTGGASDGTTAMARKLVTTANAKYVYPLVFEVAAWNDTAGTAKTATVEIVHDSLTALLDNEIWLEAEYMGSTLTPVASYVNDSADVLATGAAQTASTETWTTTGLTNPNKQKLSVTFTPQLKGYVKYRVYLAKPSYTVYVDPLVTVA